MKAINSLFSNDHKARIIEHVEIPANDFVQKMPIADRLITIGAEIGKLVSVFQAVASFLEPNLMAASLWTLVYAGCAYSQCIVIKDSKFSANVHHWQDGAYFYDPKKQQLPKHVSKKEQFAKSLIPGRGLAFLKLPKLGC